MKKSYVNNIYWLIITQFFTFFYMVQVIQTIFMSKHGLSLYQIGIVYAVYQFSKIVLELPTGIIADKYGRRISTILGDAFLIVSNLFAYFLRDYQGFIIAAIFQGVSYTLISGASDALLIDSIYASQNKKIVDKIHAILRCGRYIAIFLSSAIGGILAEQSMDLVYQITLVLQFLPIIVLTIFIIEPPYKKDDTEKYSFKKAIRHLLDNKLILHLLLIGVFTSIALIPIESHYFNYYLSFGISEKFSGSIYGLQYLMSSMIALFIYNTLKKHFSVKLVIYLPSLIMVSLVFFAIIPGVITKSIFYFITLLLLCCYAPMLASFIHGELESTYRASTLSIQSLLMAMLAFVIQPVFGKISDCYGYNKAIVLISIIAFLFLTYNAKKLANFQNKLKNYL